MKTVENIEKTATETITISREEYDKLIAQNLEMQKQIKWLMDTIKLKNNKIFGSSSEKSNKEESDQLSIFNEAEVESKLQVKEPELEEVKAHYRKKRTKKDRLPEDLPVEEIEYTLPEEEQVCSVCDEELHVIGKETVREELKIIPAKAVIVRHVRFSYACRNCEKTNTEVPVVKAPVPNAVIKGGFASPETVAYIITQKYLMDIPLYRQENDFKRRDILLSRQTMSNWIIKSSQMWLQSIYDKLHERIVSSESIHVDETTLQVLKELGKKPQSKSYMWLYRTGHYEKYKIALYKYERSRSTKHAEEFLEGFSGYLHCDGYQGYKKIENAIIVQCFAHARRKFDEALKVLKESDRKTSKAMIGFEYCNKLFEIERSIKELTPKEKYEKRQEFSKPVLDEFLVWLQSLNPAKQSRLGIAVSYTLNNWECLNNYMLDGRLNISNNSAEHLAKSFAVCRKNFLFSNTPKGADASALAMSFVETSKINNIDPFEYLTYIFKNAPQLDLTKEENIEKLLPEAFKNEKKKDS